MQLINHMRLEFDARPENESFARIAVSAFTVPFNPTLDVLSDIRTAISEAVTNAIVHAYQERGGTIALDAGLREDGRLLLSVRDWGLRHCRYPAGDGALLTTSRKRSAAAWALP